jgi:hypothetical protein
VVIAHGSKEDATKAREILGRTSPETLEDHLPMTQETALSTR